MAHFQKVDDPAMDGTRYHITDDQGRLVQLSAEQAYELLEWLYQHMEELHDLKESEDDEQGPTQHLPSSSL